jgi:tryptophanase
MQYVAKAMKRVKENAPRSKGYRLVYAPDVLAHFFAKFEPLA